MKKQKEKSTKKDTNKDSEKSLKEYCNDLKIAQIEEHNQKKRSEVERRHKEEEDKMMELIYGPNL